MALQRSALPLLFLSYLSLLALDIAARLMRLTSEPSSSKFKMKLLSCQIHDLNPMCGTHKMVLTAPATILSLHSVPMAFWHLARASPPLQMSGHLRGQPKTCQLLGLRASTLTRRVKRHLPMFEALHQLAFPRMAR